MTEPLNIGFDAKKALLNFTGLGNYSRYAIKAITTYAPKNHYHLYTQKYKSSDRTNEILDIPGIELNMPEGGLWKTMPALWRMRGGITADLKRRGIQLYHGLSNELPLDIARSGIPSVVTTHDLIFRKIPENYNPIDRRIYDYKFAHAARAATRVIAISECTRRDLIECYDIDPAKIDVVYQGCDEIFTKPVTDAEIEAVKKLYGLPERYIISVGTLEQRKNQQQAVEALAGLPGDVKLLLVGNDRNGYGAVIEETIRRVGVADRVIRLSGIPFTQLPALYAGAVLSSYTSRYEGFGLPILESISSGTPVIAATGSCLEEAGGSGGVYVSPDSVEQYVEVARQLLDDDAQRAEMTALGRQHVARFNARQFAAAVLHTYYKAMG